MWYIIKENIFELKILNKREQILDSYYIKAVDKRHWLFISYSYINKNIYSWVNWAIKC